MTLPAGLTRDSAAAVPLHVSPARISPNGGSAQPAAVGTWLDAQGFDGSAYTALVVPDTDGSIAAAVIGVGDRLDPSSYGHAPFALPVGAWRLADRLDPAETAALQLGWGLGSYRFNRYKQPLRAPATLLLEGDADDMLAELAACLRVRDLVNTPTEHMGPDQLEQVCCEIAERFGAHIEVVSGDDLLTRNFPPSIPSAAPRTARRA
jgi:leucyl aminopeptidase